MKIILLLCLLWPFPLLADYWELPHTQQYYSPDSTYFAEIVPLKIPTRYAAWKNAKSKKRHKFSAADTTLVPCHAIMFRIVNQDTIKVWEAPLSNRIAPISALVSSNGSYLITRDNWSSLGYGDNVFVVYDQQGHLIKQYALQDFSPFSVNTYFRSISSLWWCCGIKLTSSQQIQLCFQDEKNNQKTRRYNLSTLQFEL